MRNNAAETARKTRVKEDEAFLGSQMQPADSKAEGARQREQGKDSKAEGARQREQDEGRESKE